MHRIACPERPDWLATAETHGFLFHTLEGDPYWDESAYFGFTLRQIEEEFEKPSEDLHSLCLDLLDRLIWDERALQRLAIPEVAWEPIAASWQRRDPSLYGRFDLAYDGTGPAKLLEYNADTPTSLYETAVFQWLWLEQGLERGLVPAGFDQFNSAHEKLIARFAAIAADRPIHFTCIADAPEDRGTVAYLEDCARQADLRTGFVPVDSIALGADASFVDAAGERIELLFKLYPWEWAFADTFGRALRRTPTRFLEPPWKAILSNKGFLAMLWAAEPGHPNLLPTYFEDDPAKAELGPSFARKPLLSREGANVLLVENGQVVERDEGPYGAEGFVRQALAPMFRSEHGTAVIGSWMVGDDAAGIGLRESEGRITTNRSRFLPHAILPD
ncbi:MAG TPA: glutathionylspermidine synthase family protein [Beijerinckiaceae bacterium]|jgi:glutathionylspermidine synthase